MKANTAAESKPLRRLEDDREYADLASKLEQLESGRTEAIAKLAALEVVMSREDSTRSYLSRGPGAFGQRFGDQERDGFAAEVIAAGCIPEGLVARMKAGVKVLDKEAFNHNGALIGEFDDARRTREIFDRAFTTHKKSVARRKAEVIKKIYEDSKEDRTRIARTIANCVLELGQALREERALAATMGLQNEGIQVDATPPRPFPLELPWAQLLVPWTAESLGISEAEARSKAGLPSPDLERRRKELDRAAGARG